MFRTSLFRVLPAALVLTACAGEDPTPGPALPPTDPLPGPAVSVETGRLEGLARRLARALADSGFRARLYGRLQASPYPEGKIHLQRTFRGADRGELRALSRLNAESETQTDSALRATEALEVYLPVPAHRTAWHGDANLLVATAARDGEVPVAYDLRGRRQLLDPNQPPRTPVLAVVPVETDFDRPPASRITACPPDLPDCTNGGVGNPAVVGPTPGLYMTLAHFNSDFEGWLKGSPEFEIHVMGQKGSTDSLTKYQCAGEHQGGGYYWDGDTDWSGNVLLFSQSEINSYHAAHPNETFRLVAVEDDDTSCQIKVGADRWATFVGSIGPLYKDITGATDSGTVKKYIAAGKSLRKFLAAIASLIKTNDDLIGNAMEDKVVGEFHAGYNWILRADNNVTNGYVNLVMR
jgi:hypothetical protein